MDVITDQWVELFSIELDHAVAVESVELPDGQLLVAVLLSGKLEY